MFLLYSYILSRLWRHMTESILLKIYVSLFTNLTTQINNTYFERLKK